MSDRCPMLDEIETEGEEGLLTKEEVEILEWTAAAHSRHEPLTHDELDCVVQWAHKARFNSSALELVLRGLVVLTWDRDAHTVRFWSVRPEERI